MPLRGQLSMKTFSRIAPPENAVQRVDRPDSRVAEAWDGALVRSQLDTFIA
jgi:hypothetical protein